MGTAINGYHGYYYVIWESSTTCTCMHRLFLFIGYLFLGVFVGPGIKLKEHRVSYKFQIWLKPRDSMTQTE